MESQVLTPNGTKLTLHSTGQIDINPTPGSPIHVYGKPNVSYEPCMTPDIELQKLKDTLRKLTKAGEDAVDLDVLNIEELQPETKTTTPPTYPTPEQLHELKMANERITSKKTIREMKSPYESFSNSPLGTNSSKAVLSALRALQDKVKRLEAEKEEAIRQCSELKVEATKREASMMTTRKKIEYEFSQSKETLTAAYEATKNERDEIKVKLMQQEERNKTAQKEILHYKTLCASAEENSSKMNERLSKLEQQNQQLREELLQERSFLKEKDGIVQQHESQLKEMKLNVEHQQQLNKVLQQKLWNTENQLTQEMHLHRTLTAAPSNKTKKLKKKTSTSRATSTKKTSEYRSSSSLMRSTAASRANSRSTGTSKKGNATRREERNNMTRLKKANKGQVPFILGKSTAPSFSVIASVQETMARSDSYDAVAPDRKPLMPEAYSSNKNNIHVRVPRFTTEPAVEKKLKPPSSDNLAGAVASIESEFEELNQRYQQLMSNMNTPISDSINPAELNTVIDKLEAKGKQLTMVKSAQEEFEGLQQKQTQPPLPFERTVIHSPDAMRRKTAALRILRDYRELDQSMR